MKTPYVLWKGRPHPNSPRTFRLVMVEDVPGEYPVLEELNGSDAMYGERWMPAKDGDHLTAALVAAAVCDTLKPQIPIKQAVPHVGSFDGKILLIKAIRTVTGGSLKMGVDAVTEWQRLLYTER